MRMRTALAVALATVSVFATAALASAEGTLTLTASAAKVTYPHSVRLTVSPVAAPDVAKILAMPAGASEWTTLTAFATETTPSVWAKPRVTTAYKAWISDENSSTPVVVEVAAKLAHPQIVKPHNRGGKVFKGHNYVIKGTMQPAEVGTVTVSFFRLETVSVRHGKGHIRKAAWILHSSLDVGLSAQNSNTSKWATKWKPVEKGWWKIVVSHHDATHAYSSATTKKWVN